MQIQPVSVSTVTQAVENLLLTDTRFDGVSVSRSGETNADPRDCPWIGVYRSDNEFPIRVLGAGPGFRNQRINLVLLVQESDPVSGSNCEDRLNALVDKVVSALLSDTTLGGTVQTIDGFSVRYPDYRRVDDDMYMQTALVYFTAVTTVGGIQ